MKFCGECGNKLEENVKFCDECGYKFEEIELETSQAIGSEEKSNEPKRKKKAAVIGVALLVTLLTVAVGVIMFMIGIHLTSDKEDTEVVVEVEEIEEELPLREAVEWVEDEEKVEEFKGITLEEFDNRTVEDVFDGRDVQQWKVGQEDEVEYLSIVYVDIDVDIDVQFEIVINVTNTVVEELYMGDDLCAPEQFEELVEDLAEVKIVFVGKSGAYSKEGAYLNVDIEDDSVDVKIMVADYEESMSGEISGDNEAVVYLEAGEPITLFWEDEDTIKVEAKDGFHQESISIIRLICEALNGQTYTFESEKKYDQRPGFLAKYAPIEGYYINSNEGGFPYTYSVTIKEVGDSWFTFTVTEESDKNGNFNATTIIELGVATFRYANDAVAYYDDGEISLKFECPELDQMTITGYEPMTRIRSTYFHTNYFY